MGTAKLAGSISKSLNSDFYFCSLSKRSVILYPPTPSKTCALIISFKQTGPAPVWSKKRPKTSPTYICHVKAVWGDQRPGFPLWTLHRLAFLALKFKMWYSEEPESILTFFFFKFSLNLFYREKKMDISHYIFLKIYSRKYFLGNTTSDKSSEYNRRCGKSSTHCKVLCNTQVQMTGGAFQKLQPESTQTTKTLLRLPMPGREKHSVE